MKCPHCGHQINVGKLLRSKKPSAAQIEAAKLNGSKGGRPKKRVAKPLNAELTPLPLAGRVERKEN